MIFQTIKKILWMIGLYPNKCYICGSPLIEHGHIHDDFSLTYICPREDCGFN